jgi:hypothetical protein
MRHSNDTLAPYGSEKMPHTMADSLETDYASILGGALTALGYPPANGTPWRELLLRRFNLKKRMVSATPRTLHTAAGIVVPPELQAGYNLVTEKLQNGADVRPHLSRKLAEINFKDELLNDWGILHFHLGTVLEGDGFMTRTGPLLFARIDPQNAYLLGVGTHAHFSSQVLVQTLVDIWPDAMAQYEQPDILDVRFPVTDAEIKKLRKIGVTAPVRASSGKYYLGLGGGGMTFGRWPVEGAMHTNRMTKRIRHLRRYARDHLEGIATALEVAGHAVPEILNFSLRKVGDALVMSETSTNVDIESMHDI